MNLDALIEQTVSKVLEGGAAMQGDRIPQARVKPAIDAFTKEVLKGLRYKSVKPIGSTGKKESSGDLDLGLDTDLSLEDVTKAIEEKGFKVKMNKGLGEVSVLFPFEGLNTQVDLMIGPENWTQTQYYGPGDKESKYKGIHVRGLVNAIMQVVLGKSVSPARGLFSKTDPEKKYSQDWTPAITALNQKSREPWGPADLQQPFEKMWEKANRSFSPAELAEIRSYYTSFMKSTKQTMPSELGEASHMAYDKVQQVGHSKGAQVGQGNIGGARNRGTPGYPVPPEMTSKRGAEGPGDEGFKVQDPSDIYEAVDPGEIQKGIPHIDDLKPEEFMAFLKKYAEQPVSLEISEKVDGSARITFGKGAGHIWTQTKNGTRKAMSNQYPDKPMYIAIKKAHEALESKAREIMTAWPQDVDFFTAEVLYTRIPNSIEYGPNVLMIHGVHGTGKGGTFNDVISKQLANEVISAAGGKLSDGKEDWLFEYKRTINPQDVMVDVKKEYSSLGELYQELQKTPRDKNLKTKFQNIQKQVKEKLIGQLRKQKSAYGPEGGDVEGLVFRDLDNGSMVKLVDKDYFTKLNEFLWAHRKMLDMGGKVDGAWKKGVMQGFREVVAQQVLGDTSAASTMLVKNLLALSQDVAGKTPEQRADKTLAKYIKTKNLMGGDFATSFQRSLMGAFKDFKLLRQEWEQFRSQPQSMEFGGKKREFPPEHIERTEQAFQGTEAALAGIKAGMEQAATIKHPMTQKVALLKLFMGHKFEKLVSALSGGPVEEEIIREGDDWMLDGEKEDPYCAMVARMNIDKLRKHGINLGKPLGSGFYGTAYDIGGGKVLKVTTDPDEAKTSMHLKNKKLKHVAHIYEVFRFPPDSDGRDEPLYPGQNMSERFYYGIVLEKVKTIPDDGNNELEVTFVIQNFQQVVDSGWMDPAQSSASLLTYFLKIARQTDAYDEEDIRRIVEGLKEYQILEIRDELLKNRVVFEDLHGGNMGQRADGTWVAFDLGSESISPGAEPPLLEGGPIDRGTGPTDLSGDQRIDGQVELEAFIRESIQRIVETQNPNSTIGVTIGRYQPFHAGHAAIIRKLTGEYSNVVVFVAGQKQDKKNPFSHDLRLRMMELSLPDVWSKIKVFPASIQGKGTGYIPGLIANAAASNQAAIPENGSITVLVGQDRVADIQTQAQHNSQHQGEPGYYSGVVDVQALPDVKNDDDAGRISGTRLREAIALNKIEDVKKMLDPHLAQNAEFEQIYVQMRDEMKRWGLVREIIEGIINELGMGAMDGGPGATRGGGTSGWSRAILAKDMTGDEIYNQLLRSPSTRMLPMTNKGTPNDHLPGQDVLDQRDEDEVGLGDPTDLSDAIVRVISRMLSEAPTEDTDKSWHPWSPDNTVDYRKGVDAKGQQDVSKVGPGEYKAAAEPTAPCFGATIQSEKGRGFDLEKNGHKWEVKDVTHPGARGGSRINTGVTAQKRIIQFLSDVNAAMGEIKTLMETGQETMKELGVSEETWKSLESFFNTEASRAEEGEIGVARLQQLSDMFKKVGHVAKGATEKTRNIPISVTLPSGEIFQTEIPISALLKLGAVPEDKIAPTSHERSAQTVTHKWLMQPGSFDHDYKELMDPLVMFGPAEDGMVLTHQRHGWYHIPMNDVKQWLIFNGISRRAAKFKIRYNIGSVEHQEKTAVDNAAKQAKRDELEKYNIWLKGKKFPRVQDLSKATKSTTRYKNYLASQTTSDPLDNPVSPPEISGV